MKNIFKTNFIYFAPVFFLVLFIFDVPISYATVSVNQATYYIGDPIIVTDNNEYTVLFNTDTNAQVFIANHTPSQEPTYDILSSYGQNLPAGHYSLLSFYPQLNATNEDACTSYATCKTFPGFVNEAVFNVINGGGSGGAQAAPISAPSVVHGESFTPVCGTGIQFFDVVDLYSPQLCGQSINLGAGNNQVYEIRAFTGDFIYTSPSLYVLSQKQSAQSSQDTNTKKIRPKTPVINILSPKASSIFSSSVIIDYRATDENDLGSIDEKTAQGLGIKPVSIFYTDKSFDWSPALPILINQDYKNLIVKDLSAIGQYKWSIKDLIPGNLYRIIVDATDNNGNTGEAISDYFSVDFTAPVFKIKTNPIMVKSGDVKISVEASEDLQNIPTVLVTQNGGKPIKVVMSGDKDVYEGTYSVQGGYDGTAKIEIQGTDLAGNTGTEITNGGTFSIGVNPPPKPIITSDTNKTVTNDELTTLKGTVRADTDVILSVNGTTTMTIKPDSKGNFTFDKIKLEKAKNKGINYLSVVSRDVLGTISESANVEIKYNIAPTISIVKPINKSLLSGQTDILVKGADENLDTLLYTYEIISLSDYNSKTLKNNWITIASDIPGGSLSYDTTESDDGDYMIRVKVSDGYTTVTSTPVAISIKSSTSYFRFENGRKTVTKNSSVTINGRAIIPANLASFVSIKIISYSIDDGTTWTNVKFDNTIPVTEQRFSVVFDNLTEGAHPIIWRIRDSRNLIGSATHTIVVDNIAPKSPIIKNPKNGAIITNDSDEDLKKDGIQISINGTAEAGTVLSLVFNGQTLTTKVSLLGEFAFSGITLDKIGKQEIRLFNTDEAGNKSDVTVLNLIYNNPPVITFINPKPFGGLSGKAVLSWNVTDIDGNPIKNVEVNYRNGGGVYKLLVSNAQTNGTYTWDTSKLTESSGYELQINATDSITPASAVTSFFIDRTAPTLSSFNIKKEMINKKVNISGEGVATDAVSGVEYVEYSIKSDTDKERGPWYKGTITKGYLQRQAYFSIKYPKDLADNSYTVYARAVDAAGNTSNELSQNIYVDRTSPRVGSFFIIKNNLNLIPDQDGKISFYKNSVFTFAVSIEGDTSMANLLLGNKNVILNKNTASGLWEATTTLGTEPSQDIYITASDSSGNVTKNKKMGVITGIGNGNVSINNNGAYEFVEGVFIRISKFNNTTGQYDKFIPPINGVPSEVKTDKNGLYELVLPAGIYHLSAVKSGYKIIKKDITLSKEEIINTSFVTNKISGVQKIISDILSGWFY